jgi:hypothetical protein
VKRASFVVLAVCALILILGTTVWSRSSRTLDISQTEAQRFCAPNQECIEVAVPEKAQSDVAETSSCQDRQGCLPLRDNRAIHTLNAVGGTQMCVLEGEEFNSSGGSGGGGSGPFAGSNTGSSVEDTDGEQC